MLRSANPGEAPYVHDLLSDPAIRRCLSATPPPALWARQRAVEPLRKLDAERASAPWVVETRSASTFIGSAGLVLVPQNPDVEVAFHLRSSA